MACRPLTRRQALRAGASAVALTLLRPGAPALAARPALFELPIDDLASAAAATAGWRTTRVLRAPRRFDLVGLRWARGSRVEAQLRARPRGGPWTPWVTLHALGDHGPDLARALPGTDPAFVGAADELQLRLRGYATGLHARFVRALPTATAARKVTGRLRARSAARARASQAAGPPPIISRTEWGGDTVPPRTDPEYGAVQLAFVHHTVTANEYAPEDSAGIVLGIARYHRDSNGWNDIGYNFLVDKYGQVFEGRAGGIEAAVVGAQAQGYNSQSTGVACLGDFSAIAQTGVALEALARLIGWKLSLHGVPVQGAVTVASAGGPTNRYPSGTPVTFQRIAGHRDGDQTSCPGDVLYGQLADLRARAARYASPVSSVTVHAASRRQVGTRPVPLSGSLRFADGSSPAGAALSVEYATAGSAWTQVATTTCGTDGAWAASVALPATGTVRVVFPGDGVRPRLESPPLGVTVQPALSIAVSARRARAGRPIAVSGTVSPDQPTVTCVLERQVRGRWRLVRRRSVTVRTGRYGLTVRPAVPGRYRVWIVAGAANRHRTLHIAR